MDRTLDAIRRALSWVRDSELAVGAWRGLIVGVILLGGLHWLSGPSTARPADALFGLANLPPLAVLEDERISADVRIVARWIAVTNDAHGAPFVIVDKKNAALHAFAADARLRASTPVLLGGALGDDSVPGVGDKAIADVTPAERTTPAGRFVGERGRNARGEDVVWVDYDAGVSMHRVLTTDPLERRLERLASMTIADNRISYGCINVPVAFYERYVAPLFGQRRAIVYVLPETRSLAEIFDPDHPLFNDDSVAGR